MVESAKDRSLNEGFYNSMHFHVASAEELPFNDNFLIKYLFRLGLGTFQINQKH